tara:strand:- start:274 stop:597 length:324 start_codon:yes stop_codon:yes gene_type:complete
MDYYYQVKVKGNTGKENKSITVNLIPSLNDIIGFNPSINQHVVVDSLDNNSPNIRKYLIDYIDDLIGDKKPTSFNTAMIYYKLIHARDICSNDPNATLIFSIDELNN